MTCTFDDLYPTQNSQLHIDGNGHHSRTSAHLLCDIIMFCTHIIIFLQREGKGTSSQAWCLLPDQLSPSQPMHNPPLTSNPNHHTVNTLREWKLILYQPLVYQWPRKAVKKEVKVAMNERLRKIGSCGLGWMSWRERRKSIWQKREKEN